MKSVWNLTNQSRVSEAGKFEIRNGRDSIILKNRFLRFLYYIQKEWITQEIKSVHIEYKDYEVGIKDIQL